MTVSSTQFKSTYIANGVTSSFAYPFKVYDESHIKVYLNGELQSSGYTISGVGDSSGQVTFIVNPPNSTVVHLERSVPATQLTDYNPYDAFPAETHERALDLLAMTAQQAQDGEVLKKSKGYDQWDATGKRISNVSNPVSINDVANVAYVDSLAISSDLILAQQILDASDLAQTSADQATNFGGIYSNIYEALSLPNDKFFWLVSPDTESALDLYKVVSTTPTDQNKSIPTRAYLDNAISETEANKTDAADSATASANSATAASDSATASANSATAASDSATLAADIYDDFDDRYLGPKSSAPLVDNDGAPLQVGAIYFNTPSNRMEVYNNTWWPVASEFSSQAAASSATAAANSADEAEASATAAASSANSANTYAQQALAGAATATEKANESLSNAQDALEAKDYLQSYLFHYITQDDISVKVGIGTQVLVSESLSGYDSVILELYTQ